MSAVGVWSGQPDRHVLMMVWITRVLLFTTVWGEVVLFYFLVLECFFNLMMTWSQCTFIENILRNLNFDLFSLWWHRIQSSLLILGSEPQLPISPAITKETTETFQCTTLLCYKTEDAITRKARWPWWQTRISSWKIIPHLPQHLS
jgi:hypothetical protein